MSTNDQIMKTIAFLLILFSIITSTYAQIGDYITYHNEVTKCEQLIAEKRINEACQLLDSLFNQFDFVFLREYKLAAELSIYDKDYESAFRLIRQGILNGWSFKSLKKNKSFKELHDDSRWEDLKIEYDSLRKIYLSSLDITRRNQVHDMFKKDQKKALGAFFKIRQKAQDNYAEKSFAPHSEKQLGLLDTILIQAGYPGEKLIGNNLWASVILSHHNSISFNYNSKDTLYNYLRPKLMNALRRGEISPYELAQIDDWRTAALSSHGSTSFGFIGKITNNNELGPVNKNRAEIGLRSIELRNNLIDIENSTGLNLYLPKGWQNGKITVAKKR